MGSFSAGLDFMLDNVLTSAAGTGWPFLLLIFLVHFSLSLAVAVMIWFHGRHLSRPVWLPNSTWTGIVGGSLLIASLVFPLGMIPPLAPERLVGSINVDPFFLFLLPLTVTVDPLWLWGGATLALTVVIGLPWVLRRRRPSAVEVIAERCIGCTWCATDCPYGAITMVDTPDADHLHLAEVDPSRCVSCGICLGSCPTQALALDGLEPRAMWTELEAVDGDAVRITCGRHADLASSLDAATLVVPCVGMVAPRMLEAAADLGLTTELVACPVDDCSYREGSAHLAERFDHRRPPHIRGAYREAPITMLAAPPGSLDRAEGPVLDQPPLRRLPWRRAIPLVTLVAAVAGVSIWIANLDYDVGEADRSAITISVDHKSGYPLVGDEPFAPSPTGATPLLRVVIDGEVRREGPLPIADADAPNTALLYERYLVSPGTHELTVTLTDSDASEPRLLFADTVAMAPGEALVLEYRDQEVLSASEAGQRLFENTVRGVRSGCVVCHSTDPGRTLVGPSLAGIASRAGSTVPGLGAEEYLRQSIVDPDTYVVPGFPSGQMLPDLADSLTGDEIDQLVAYMLTLD